VKKLVSHQAPHSWGFLFVELGRAHNPMGVEVRIILTLLKIRFIIGK